MKYISSLIIIITFGILSPYSIADETKITIEKNGEDKCDPDDIPSPISIFNQLDTSGDGFLNFVEFKLPHFIEPNDETKRSHFDILDRNSDNAISLQEFIDGQPKDKRGGRTVESEEQNKSADTDVP